ISGDRNPLHYDEAAAAASRFGEIIVQGGVTSAILNAVVAEDLPGPGTVFLELNLRFLAPVRPGDDITGEVTVTDVREDKPNTRLDVAVTRGDGVRAIEGAAACYTVALPCRHRPFIPVGSTRRGGATRLVATRLQQGVDRRCQGASC